MEKELLDKNKQPPDGKMEWMDYFNSGPFLGLNLDPESSLEEEITKKIYGEAFYDSAESKLKDYQSRIALESLKISKFSASLIRIGSWERVTRDEGDVAAKFYYVKKSLLWEFFENGSKNKIEVKWDDVLAIKATIHENVPAILEVVLKQPPMFYHEANPCPKQHPSLTLIPDFTGGQATTCRRHYLEFPPGALDEHYEKLLNSNSYLRQCSQNLFPPLLSPYFETDISYTIQSFPSHLAGVSSEISQSLYLHQPQFPSCLSPARLYLNTNTSSSPVSVVDQLHMEEQRKSLEHSRVHFEGLQEIVCNSRDISSEDQIMQVNQETPYQTHAPAGFNEGSSIHHARFPNNISSHLLNQRPVICLDEMKSPASAHSPLEPISVSIADSKVILNADERTQQQYYPNPACLIPPQASSYGASLTMQNNTKFVSGANEIPVSKSYSQAAHLLPRFTSGESSAMQKERSTLFYKNPVESNPAPEAELVSNAAGVQRTRFHSQPACLVPPELSPNVRMTVELERNSLWSPSTISHRAEQDDVSRDDNR